MNGQMTLIHVPSGIVHGGEKLATRTGKVVLLKDHVRSYKKTLEIIESKNPHWKTRRTLPAIWVLVQLYSVILYSNRIRGCIFLMG